MQCRSIRVFMRSFTIIHNIKSTTHFLVALKKQIFLLLIPHTFFLAVTFAVTPHSFFEERTGKTSSESHDSSRASDREDSPEEARGTTRIPLGALQTASVTDNENFNEDDSELAAINAGDFDHRSSSVIATAVDHSEQNFHHLSHSFVTVPSVARAVTAVCPLSESTTLPIVAIHSADYLKNLRDKLFPHGDSCSTEDELREMEIAVNRAALADGVSIEELRLLHAQETYDFFLRAFKEAQHNLSSAFLPYCNMTQRIRGANKNSQEMWRDYSKALENQKKISEELQLAEQELETAYNEWKSTGIGTAVVATAIVDEENAPR